MAVACERIEAARSRLCETGANKPVPGGLRAHRRLVVLVVSFIQGPPDAVPAVALGWPVLLYLERAALVAGVIIGIGGTADRLLRGDVVQGFSAPGGPGVQVAEQAAKGVADTADNAAEAVEAVKNALDEGLRELDERLARLEGKD
jgi:hypothetical protein